ncbi:MAG: hypothetical protein AABX70_02850 [Nanoarchaeota archaeon]
MTLSPIEYEVKRTGFTIDVPGFEGVVFTPTPEAYLTYPNAVTHTQGLDSILASDREAWAHRIGAQGDNHGNDTINTRGASHYFLEDGVWQEAFDDSPNPKENLVILGSTQYADNIKDGRLTLPRSNQHIDAAIQRARELSRILPVVEKGPVKLSLAAKDGVSEYGSNPRIRIRLGEDLAERAAAYLAQKGFEYGYVCPLTTNDLTGFRLDPEQVEVRPGALGGGCGCYGLYYLYAGRRFISGGRALGVRHVDAKKSP